MDVLGVDACPGGWVGVVLRDGRFSAALSGRALKGLLDRVPDAPVVAVDIPLGLLERGWRQADLLARARLKPYGSSVFPVPPRAVWDERDYEAAKRVCREVTGAGLTVQSWGLAAKLREAAGCRKHDPRLHEVHPEVSFSELGGAPVAWSKKTWNGQAERRRVLAEQGIALPTVLEGDAGRVPPDDVLDAAAAAWSAHRIATGRAGSLPEVPEESADGLPVAIWF